MLTIAALVVLALVVPPLLIDLFRPTVRRLGLRNAVRRPGEAALVVAGSMLATALITASLLIGDSFGASVRNQVGVALGPIDEIVVPDDPATTNALASDLTNAGAGDDDPAIDGALPVRYGTVSAGAGATVLGRLTLLEADLDAARAFGDDPAATGLESLATPAPSGLVVAEPTAATLGVTTGDTVEIFAGADPVTLTVAAVVPRQGLAGFGDLLVVPDTVTGLLDDADDVTVAAVLVSNVGDVTDGADMTDDAVAEIETATTVDGTVAATIDTAKQDLLDEADADADDMTELFGTIGGFSVAAGILLLVNLFVMLAQERRRELGTLSAIGLDRAHLRRAFALEGAVYGVVAAIAGAALGVVVASAVTRFAPSISSGDDVAITLDVQPMRLLTGAAVGFAISQLTVTITAARLTRVDIVSALKDLAPPPVARGGRTRRLVAIAAIVVGVELLVTLGDQPYVVLLTPAVLALAVAALVAPPLPPRPTLAVAAAAGAVTTALAFSLWDDALADPGFDVFLVQGVVLVGLAVTVLAAMAPVLAAPVRRLGRGSTAMRVGLAHPLDRPARSGLLIAMYALVIFTVTFMAILNTVFQQQVPDLARRAGGEFDVLVDTNPTNPLTAAELVDRPDVAAVVAVAQGEVAYRIGVGEAGSTDNPDESDTDWWWTSVVPADFPAERGPETAARADEFADDAAAWTAVAADDGWVIAPTDAGLVPGETIELLPPDDGTTATVPVRVAATVEYDFALESGLWVGPGAVASFYERNDVVTRHYLVVADGVSPRELAAAVGEERTHGAVATSFLAVAQADVDEQQAFIRLLQGYLGLGLVIGITGLAVVLVRAVRERRSQLATLAAIGSPPSELRSMIVIEALFVGVQGVVLGLGLGTVSAWLVITKSTAFAADLRFAVPWVGLAGLLVLALVASFVAGLVPARRAGRIHPAAALRAG